MTKRAMGMSFRGRTVLITGGARGLGLEMARAWAAEGVACRDLLSLGR